MTLCRAGQMRARRESAKKRHGKSGRYPGRLSLFVFRLNCHRTSKIRSAHPKTPIDVINETASVGLGSGISPSTALEAATRRAIRQKNERRPQ